MKSRTVNWDAVAAIIAALVGLLALVVGGYTAYVQHQGVKAEIKGVRAQVWPYLEIGETGSLPNHTGSSAGGRLIAINEGVGPAIVRSMQVFVNGKSEPDWIHVFKAVDVQPSNRSFSTLNKSVLSPRKTLGFLVIHGQKDWSRFKKKLYKYIVIRVCYCSTLGRCWLSTLDFKNPIRQGVPVSSCPNAKKTVQFIDATRRDLTLASKPLTTSPAGVKRSPAMLH